MTTHRRLRLLAEHAELIESTYRRLATDFETPATRIIAAACAQMNMTQKEWRLLGLDEREFEAHNSH
jgi:hypothetical protein